MRSALYLRISKDDQQTGLAVERQRAECLKVIDRAGLEVTEVYTDNGVSAYARTVKRPAFDRMTADYERQKFDAVVCWDLDRFSRQPAQLEHWIELGETRGLKIFTPTGLYARLAVNGAANSSSNYVYEGSNSNASQGLIRWASQGNGFWDLARLGNDSPRRASVSMDISEPFETSGYALVTWQSTGLDANGATSQSVGGQLNVDSTAFDGLLLFPSQGNLSGTIRVYGYGRG